jgi:hypothetical protein
MHYHRVTMTGQDKRQEWRISTTFGGPPVPWRPGYGLPRKWRSRLERDDLPYYVELELTAGDAGPQCRSARFEARNDDIQITARQIREIPMGECIQLAVTAAAMRADHRPNEIAYQLGGGHYNLTEQFEEARPLDRRTDDERVREAARVYAENEPTGKPKMAVEAAMNISSSTASRLIREGRRRGFLAPSKRGTRAGSSSEAKPRAPEGELNE